VKLAVICLCLTGCELVFPLDEPQVCPLPAMPACGSADPDEDEDAVRDDCDPCPQVFGSDADRDGDGIGDLCDPEPDTFARCQSRRFFGMNGAVGWDDTTSWSFDKSAFLEDPDASLDTIVVLRSSAVFETGRIDGLIEDGANPGRDNELAGFATMLDGDIGYFCGFAGPATNTTGRVLLARLAPNGEQVLATGAMDLGVTPGQSHRVQFTVTASGTLGCAVQSVAPDTDPASFDPDEELVFQDPTPLPSGAVGLVLRSSSASFEYLDFVPD